MRLRMLEFPYTIKVKICNNNMYHISIGFNFTLFRNFTPIELFICHPLKPQLKTNKMLVHASPDTHQITTGYHRIQDRTNTTQDNEMPRMVRGHDI